MRVILFTALLIFFSVALVIINNAMVMATLQRVKEIGTMRAIGAQRRFVVVMLLVEIGGVGLLFGLAGALAGRRRRGGDPGRGRDPGHDRPALLRLRGPRPDAERWGRWRVGLSLVIVLAVSILSALYPAVIAMKVTPVEAMSTDD